MRKMVEKILCDRCGEEITGVPIRISPHYARDDEFDNELPLWIERIINKDFCRECMEIIADFALNKNACDECVQEMEEERRMLQDYGEE